MANKYFGKKVINLSNQVLGMKKYFPAFECIWKGGVAIWTGTIQPTAISESYKIKVCYSLNKVPQVWVISPELIKRKNGENIPHIYSKNELCLYYPKYWEWNKNMIVAETILPWTSLWLYYYELWHATGKWLGEGIHPRRKKK